jgi:plastocyanin
VKLPFVVILLLSSLAIAQAGSVKDGKVVKSARDEIARLERELAEQRALLVRILQLQLEHDQQLLKLAQGQPFVAPVVEAAPAPAPVMAPVVAPRPVEPAAAPASAKKVPTAVVTGKVRLAGSSGPAYVFIEDVKGPMSSGSLEIKQEDKQFAPRIAVVPRGTTVSFPNYDTIFHNVFSVSVGNAFDLGTARAGDAVKSHAMTTPGVVQIFCNMHSRMSAAVLVTPSNLFAKVGADGSFRIDGVPVGNHRISAWAGGEALSTQNVEVASNGGEVELQLNAAEPGPHKNKLGQAYGSYGD